MLYFSLWVLFVVRQCTRRIYQSSYPQPIPQVSSQYMVSKQNLNFDFTPTAKDSLRSEPIVYLWPLEQGLNVSMEANIQPAVIESQI